MNRNELYHFGIKGMRWGVRNGPPYPLEYEQKSNQEKRSNYKFRLTDKQKKYVKIGAGIAAALLVSYGTYKLGTKLKPYSVGDLLLMDPEGKIPVGDAKGKIKEALQAVNPSNESNHCQQNSLAACLNYLGGNVQTKAGMWSTSPGSIVDKCFKGDISKKVKEPNLVFKTADQASDWIIRRMKPEEGSCGTISCKLARSAADGHAIMWRMENGAIHYSDPWARTLKGPIAVEDASFYFGKVFSGEHPCISRVDNLEINYDEFFKYFERR